MALRGVYLPRALYVSPLIRASVFSRASALTPHAVVWYAAYSGGQRSLITVFVFSRPLNDFAQPNLGLRLSIAHVFDRLGVGPCRVGLSRLLAIYCSYI